jgi:hypothetical protein
VSVQVSESVPVLEDVSSCYKRTDGRTGGWSVRKVADVPNNKSKLSLGHRDSTEYRGCVIGIPVS